MQSLITEVKDFKKKIPNNKNLPKISQYYKQQQYNVLQTAVDNIKTICAPLTDLGFLESSNVVCDIMQELQKLGYGIRRIY